MAEMKDTHTSPVISRALKTHLDSLEGAIFNIQKCFVPACYPPKEENGEYYQLCHIDACSGKIQGASTAFQFLQEQPAEDSDPVPNDFMDILTPNKSEGEEMKQVQEKKHEIEEEKSNKEKVIALKVQPQSRAEQAILLEKISTLEAGMQQLAQEVRVKEHVCQLLYQSREEERERSSNLEDELKLKCQSLESENNELHENNNKMLKDYTNMKSICESFMNSQNRAVIKAPKSYQPLRCEVFLKVTGKQCIQEAERYTDADSDEVVLCSEHYQRLKDIMLLDPVLHY